VGPVCRTLLLQTAHARPARRRGLRTHDARRGHAHPHPGLFSSCLALARPPLSSFTHSQPLALTSHRAHTPGSSATVRCDRASVPPPLLGARRICFLCKLRHVTRSSGRPLVHPRSLWFTWSMLTGSLPQLHRRRPVSSLCPGHRSCVSETSLKVIVLASPLFSPIVHLLARDCSLECSPVRRGLPSAVRPSQSHSHKPDPAIVLAKSSPTSPAIRTDLSRPRSPSLPRLWRRRHRVRGKRHPSLPG
jgi:hypothetical protein